MPSKIRTNKKFQIQRGGTKLLPASIWGWHEQARCREVDPEIFFSEETDDPSLELVGQGKWEEENARTRWARKICTGCEVRLTCLNAAIEMNEPHGIWGGMTPSERSRIKRGRPVIEKKYLKEYKERQRSRDQYRALKNIYTGKN